MIRDPWASYPALSSPPNSGIDLVIVAIGIDQEQLGSLLRIGPELFHFLKVWIASGYFRALVSMP